MNADIKKAKALLESNGYVVSDPVTKDDLLDLIDRAHDSIGGRSGVDEDDERALAALVRLVEEHGP